MCNEIIPAGSPSVEAGSETGSKSTAESFAELPAQFEHTRSHMAEGGVPARIVLTTTADADEAARLGRTLVEERLAACATLIPAVQSIYRWQGQVESSTETLLLLKTGPDQLAALEDRLLRLHSYQTPEFLVLGVESASHGYLEWLQSSLRQV